MKRILLIALAVVLLCAAGGAILAEVWVNPGPMEITLVNESRETLTAFKVGELLVLEEPLQPGQEITVSVAMDENELWAADLAFQISNAGTGHRYAACLQDGSRVYFFYDMNELFRVSVDTPGETFRLIQKINSFLR